MTSTPRHARTKIIATLGPASRHPDVIEALVRAGADGFRLNFSHINSPEEAEPVIATARRVAERVGVPIPLIADIQGPKLRVGAMPDEGVLLREGQRYILRCGAMEIGNEEAAPCKYEQLADDVSEGTAILLADGRLELVVDRVDGRDVVCTVRSGGRLYSRKGINVPHTRLSVDTLTEKDRADLKFIASTDIDIVAVSFVRRAEDIELARSILGQTRARVPVMAKLELPEVLDVLDEVMDASDGVMIARGDLAVEAPFESVPRLQKRILERARAKGKWSIVATQMLGSMVLNSRPSRAEVSDVVNAVLEGTDALMLSEESATGEHPVAAVDAMNRIALEAESMLLKPDAGGVEVDATSFSSGAAQAAVGAADRLGAKAIVALAGSGPTALAVSKWQPVAPVVALSAKDETLRRLNLLRGVRPVRLDGIQSFEDQLITADAYLIDRGWAEPGDVTVAVAAVPLGSAEQTNTIRFHHVRPVDGR